MPEPSAPAPVQAVQAPIVEIQTIETEAPTPMDVDIPSAAETTIAAESPAPATTAPKKKKKKASYKNMMKDMLKSEANGKDGKEADKLRQGLGGGHFSKIDKI